jgi:anti-sigma factor RsiW
MNCDSCQAALGDLVDGTLDSSSEPGVRAHLATCARCRAMADDFAAIRLAARDLEQPVPPARVWTRLSTALEAERQQRRRWWSWSVAPSWRRAAAAAVLLLVVGGLSWIGWRQLTSTPGTVTTAPAPSPVDADLVRSVETELKLAEEHYEKAITGLEQIANAGRDSLDPQVAAVLQKNLSVIDQAIGESRDALRTQPASDVAQQSLFGALRSKVTLLQETVTLINEMRKGNQEGAARIVSGLEQ